MKIWKALQELLTYPASQNAELKRIHEERLRLANYKGEEVKRRIAAQENFYREALPLLGEIAQNIRLVLAISTSPAGEAPQKLDVGPQTFDEQLDASYFSPAQWDARIHSIAREMDMGDKDWRHWKQLAESYRAQLQRVMNENDALRMQLRFEREHPDE